MGKSITWVGLDAHKKSITVARLTGRRKRVETWTVSTEQRAVRRLVRKLRREAGEGEIRCCYEAGPLGYVLQRWIEGAGAGVICEVVAPSLIPVKPGERIKTDRRDAQKLAELFRGGLLTKVHPPTASQEAVRDLCRCRVDAKQDQLRSRHRLKKFLLRRGLIWNQGSSWTLRHMAWLRRLSFEESADRVVFQDYLRTVEEAAERVKRLDLVLEETARQEPYAEPVGWLRCLRGVDTVTALTVVAELHGIERFSTARELMSYLGLTPSEHSSSDKVRRGKITKAGNSHVRRVLVEAAWSQRYQPRVGRTLRRRREGQPAWVIREADRAMHRLNRKYQRLFQEGKKPQGKVVTAVARELVGFMWAILRMPGAEMS